VISIRQAPIEGSWIRPANGASSDGLRDVRADVAAVTAAPGSKNARTGAFVSIFVSRKAMAVM